MIAEINPWHLLGNVVGWGLVIVTLLLFAGVIVNLVRSTKWRDK